VGLHVLGYVSLPLPGLEHLISQFVAYSHYLPHCPSSKWHIYICVCVCIHIYKCIYAGCPWRIVPDFGRVLLMLKYTDITQTEKSAVFLWFHVLHLFS